MDAEIINVLASDNATTDVTLSNECFLLRSESTNNKPPLTPGAKLDPISASSRRSRRNCLTRSPSGRLCEPPQSLTKLPPLGASRARAATPTKERIMKMFSNIPESLMKNPLDNNKPANRLDSLSDAFSASTSNLNQEVHDLTPVRSESVCKGPAKRRVRSSYGVRLESIRVGVGVELDIHDEKLNIRKIHSNDEYQPNRKQGTKLTPLTLVHPDQL